MQKKSVVRAHAAPRMHAAQQQRGSRRRPAGPGRRRTACDRPIGPYSIRTDGAGAQPDQRGARTWPNCVFIAATMRQRGSTATPEINASLSSERRLTAAALSQATCIVF